MPIKLQFPPVFPLSPQKRKRRKHSNLLLLLNPLAITQHPCKAKSGHLRLPLSSHPRLTKSCGAAVERFSLDPPVLKLCCSVGKQQLGLYKII